MADLDLPQDYRDFLRELREAEVDFLLIGGWALAVHGHGRATDDLDVLVRADQENAARLVSALRRFGAPLEAHGVTADLFAEEHYGYRVGRKPVLIEILTTIDGVTFDDASRDALTVRVEGREIQVIGRAALVANKKASGRPKDLADVHALGGDQGED